MGHNLGIKLEGSGADRGRLVVRQPIHLPQMIGGPDRQGGAEGVRRLDGDQAVVRTFHLREGGMRPAEGPADRSGSGAPATQKQGMP